MVVVGEKEVKRREDELVVCCYDCERKYGNEYGFPDLVIPDGVWAQISPTGDDGGLLCPCCIIKRLVAKGLTNVSACFMSGPIKAVSEEELRNILDQERAKAV